MAAELVPCPHCGRETRVTVPPGQKGVRVLRGGYPPVTSDEHLQRPTCENCKKRFVVVTKES